MYDLDASLQMLSARLKEMRLSDWSPTPWVKELRVLADHLEQTAEMLEDEKWMQVEDAFDADPPPETGLDGYPIEPDPDDSRQGMFQATKWRLRDIAEVARQEADTYPDSRARPEIPYAADCFLHIWYQCNKERPTMYDNSEAVLAFGDVCRAAGIPLSETRLRTALSAKWNKFDAAMPPDELDDLLVSSVG